MKILVRKAIGHTAVSAIKADSFDLATWNQVAITFDTDRTETNIIFATKQAAEKVRDESLDAECLNTFHSPNKKTFKTSGALINTNRQLYK